jgi:hypothetical protein
MEVYVVIDTMGDGRIVGVFSSESGARDVIGQYGDYYKLRRCQLDVVDAEVVGWARNDAQRQWLERFIGRNAGG